MDGLNNRNKWIIGKSNNILLDKEKMLQAFVFQMLTKSTQIFKYSNLPDSIEEKDIETLLQVNGYAIWHKVDGKLYVFTGGLGGEPNAYYLPTIATISNPALNYSKNLKIDDECVVMNNDYYYQGLMPLFNKYGNLLVEAELSLKYAIINARIPALIQADNDTAYTTAVEFINKIVEGKDYGIIGTNNFFDGIKTQDFHKLSSIKDLIEAIQYIKGSLFNEIGLNAAFNMKREAINEAEATLNEDILYPTLDAMLECRRIALEKINKMYGENITVDYNSVWKQNREQERLALELEEATIAEMETQANGTDEENKSSTVQEEPT